MRLLADENFPKPIVEELCAAGHDVLWARTDCAGWKDVALLDAAESEKRIVLTLDKDFWQIAIQRRPAGTIRCGSVPGSSGNTGECRAARAGVCSGEPDMARTHQHHHCHRNSDGGRTKELTLCHFPAHDPVPLNR
jgi:predicted nuclease of predicted toxin-antitoxin system